MRLSVFQLARPRRVVMKWWHCEHTLLNADRRRIRNDHPPFVFQGGLSLHGSRSVWPSCRDDDGRRRGRVDQLENQLWMVNASVPIHDFAVDDITKL